MIGRTIGRYRIAAELGAGGMGVVYRAHDPVLQRDIALKLLAPHLASDSQARQDFLSEAIAAAKLTHPNIVTVYEAGVENDQVFIGMEIVDGGDLRDELERSGRLSPERVCSIVKDIAEALDYSHTPPHPVIHRDIKPANILMTRSGRPKVADFGIAKMQGDSRTGTGILKGTIGYMAPELFAGVKPNPKTDQWSLGVLAYELFSGVHPFGDERNSTNDHLSVMMRIARANPPKLLLASSAARMETALDRTVRKALSRDPAQRFGTCTEFSMALQKIVSPSITGPRRFSRLAIGLVTLLLIAVIALAVVTRGPYEPPAAFKEQVSVAERALNYLAGEAAAAVRHREYITEYGETLEQVEGAGSAIIAMDIPDEFTAQGYYYSGCKDLYEAYHYAAIGDLAGLNNAIDDLCGKWLTAARLNLSTEYQASASVKLDQFRHLKIMPSSDGWTDLRNAFPPSE